jgi:hypothetical protein
MMGKEVDVGVAEDYCVLYTPVGEFYFGYESALETDPDCNWRFTFTTDGKQVCSFTLDELAKLTSSRNLTYDDTAAVMLAGIGYCLQQGWLKVGDLTNGGAT